MHARLNAVIVSRPDTILRQERAVVGGGIALVSAASWLYVVLAARDMYGDMTGLAAWMMSDAWDLTYVLLIFMMWTVMMAGMMLPTAVPTAMTFATIVRSRPEPEAPVARTYLFAGGYVLAWTVFSALATLVQWMLAEARLLSPMMESASGPLTGWLLVVAGLYQCTPMKQECLRHCRAPMVYLCETWRPGLLGALQMGTSHGFYCIGCCWALMLLLFAAGVMSLPAIVLLTVFVLIEKLAPFGEYGGMVSGALMAAAGLTFLL